MSVGHEVAGSVGQAEWLERDRQSVAQSGYPSPLVLERGRGCEITEVIRRQAESLMQIGNRFTNRARIMLAERLAALAPDPLGVSLFCSTGSEANETALRIAELVTGRFEVVTLARGYHGRTGAAYAASSSVRRMRRGSGPPPPGVVFVTPPYAFRCGSCDVRCWRQSVEMLDRASTGEPAAVIMEFVLGAGGIIPVPVDWAREVREFCDERGALLIADEALTGLGRTGRWFAFEHTGIVPDIVVTSKALGGGVPAAAVITTRSIADLAMARGFLQAASHLGDPFQCAVAMANLTVMEEEGLVANAERMGARLSGGLTRLSTACLERGLIVGGLRPGIREGSTLRFAPPLTVSAAEIDEALAILEAALDSVMSL